MKRVDVLDRCEQIEINVSVVRNGIGSHDRQTVAAVADAAVEICDLANLLLDAVKPAEIRKRGKPPVVRRRSRSC